MSWEVTEEFISSVQRELSDVTNQQHKRIMSKLEQQDHKLSQILDAVKKPAPRRASYKGDGSSLAHGGVALSPDITLPAPRKLSSDSAEPGAPTGPTHPGTPGGRATPGTPGSFRPKQSFGKQPIFSTNAQEEQQHWEIAAKSDGNLRRRRFASLRVENADNEKPRSFVTRMVLHPAFDLAFALVVVTNSIYIGMEVQYSMTNLSNAGNFVFHIIGAIYAFLFTIELGLRIWGLGCRTFFCSQDWAWSLLDIFIVATSLWEFGLFLMDALATDGDAGSISGVSGLKAFRIVRLTRLLKTVKLMRIFRFVLALRMLITSILHTLKSLFWALILLLLIVYVFAVLFVQAVHDHRTEVGVSLSEEEISAYDRYFDSLPTTMITLFMSISSGVSWEHAMFPLMKISPLWMLCFLFFVSFTYFAVLNVITAVFCESAIESAQNDQFTVVQSILANKESHLEKVRTLFLRLGAADNGFITFQMLEESINSEAVHEYFQSLGLDIWDAWTFFRLLDSDGGGEVEVEEFLMGCLRLRGPATAMDMGKVLRDQTWLVQTLGRFSAYVEGELCQVKMMLEEQRRSI